MMRIEPRFLQPRFATAPLGARAADLVVWWQKGFYAQEDEAVAEISPPSSRVLAGRSNSLLHPQLELPGKIAAASSGGPTA